VDLDADGNNDILSGSYSRVSQPMAGLFQVLWGQPDGTFKEAAELLGTDGEPLIIPADEQNIIENICTRPMAVDWDADGDLDLVVGNFAGSFYVFSGEGKGQFLPEPKKIMVGDQPLKIDGHHSDPFPVDWDADGDVDLVSGSSNGGVQWTENVAGSDAEPAFERFAELISPGQTIQYGQPLKADDLTGPTSSTRVWVDDVNSDGKLDVLVGDSVMLVSRPEGLTEEEVKEKEAKWQEDYAAASQEYSAALSNTQESNTEKSDSSEDNDPDDSVPDESNAEKQQAAMEKLQKVYASRSEFIIEDRTGFVWLYLQK
jgi:hypothetical protein